LSAYGIATDAIDGLVDQMEKHKLNAIGEHKDINPEVARKILEDAA
jgi:NADP-dependent alcohol dehydrogenase